jgi:membrane associated rhomboid family serine protease
LFGILTTLFSGLLALGIFCLIPIRNSVAHKRFPLATYLLIAANILITAAAIATRQIGDDYGIPNWPDDMVFDGDFSEPWTLIVTQFMNANLVTMAISLWMLYILGPVLEDRLTAAGLLIVYLAGGAATLSLYAGICSALGAAVAVAPGVAPSLFAILGFYVILYPFEEIVFYYNVFFFIFSGTAGVASLFLVVFIAAVHAVIVAFNRALVLFIAPTTVDSIAWLEDAMPLLGLAVGFVGALAIFGPKALAGGLPHGAFAKRRRRKDAPALPAELGDGPSRDPELRVILGKNPTPEKIETYVQQCLTIHYDEALERGYAEHRHRYPDRSLQPGVQAAVAKRFEQTNRTPLAIEAYHLLLQHHPETPIANESRLRLARILADDPAARQEAIGLLDDFLANRPAYDLADEGRHLREALRAALAPDADAAGSRHGSPGPEIEDTYTGLSPHAPFRFSPGAPPATTQRPDREEGLATQKPDREGGPPLASKPAFALDSEPSAPNAPSAISETTAGEEETPPPPLANVAPDPSGQTLTDWGQLSDNASQAAAAMNAARSCAVILLPGEKPVDRGIFALLAGFWAVTEEQALEIYRDCRGVLIDDTPTGRAIVLGRKMRALGVPAAIVPLVPDIEYPTVEDVTELFWTDKVCGNLTTLARHAFDWNQVRLVNAGRVGLPGGGPAFRNVLDLFIRDPHCHLRVWENTLNFSRSRLAGRTGTIDSLQPLLEYLDVWATHALKTPAFRAAAKKTGPPVDFHLPSELEHYNRWFLYAAFGKYTGGG